jgi:hypothetical protein
VPKCAWADGEFGGEFELRRAGLVPDRLHVDVGNAVNAYLHRPDCLVCDGLLEASLDARKFFAHDRPSIRRFKIPVTFANSFLSWW